MTEAERKARMAAYTRKWRAKNPEKMKAARAAWAARNPSKAKERYRRYYSKNAAKMREVARRWRAENPDKVRALNKANRKAQQDYYANHREECKAASNKSRRKRAALARSMNEAAYFIQTLTQLDQLAKILHGIAAK